MENEKAKFLYELGIRKDNYPTSFLEKIEDISKLITNTEIGYCAVSSRCDGKPEKFCIRDVVGTDHPRYAGKTWLDAFLDLDRGENIIELYRNNPGYWEEMKSLDNADIGLLKYGGKYYIFGKAGGGNNRIITMKMKYLSLIHQAGDDTDEIEKINNEFTFSANVRELPKDNTIPFVVVAMGEDLSGLDIRQENELFIVTKKFTDIELFRGNAEELKEYFKSLFDVNTYGEEVNNRLEMLERGCRFSGKKHRMVLESILPQFKGYKQLDER